MKLQNLINDYARIVVQSTITGENPYLQLASPINEIMKLCDDRRNIGREINGLTDLSKAATVLYSIQAEFPHEMTALATYVVANRAIAALEPMSHEYKNAVYARLCTFFGSLDKLINIVNLAHRMPEYGYRGHLDEDQFLDFLIMGDVYQLDGFKTDDKPLNVIRRQAMGIVSMHHQFSREQIIRECKNGHQAVNNLLAQDIFRF